MIELNEKIALVTGASRGIGAATARKLAEHHAKVVLAARTTHEINAVADEIRSAGGTAGAIACNVTDYSDVAAAVDHCVKTYGRLDILINNAGAIEPISRIADSDPDEWGMVADVNYKGVYHGLRAAIPVMEKQGSGIIVNVSSGAATGALEGWSHYCSSKAAALSLTRCADKEVGDRGIRVVGFSPGTVATDMQVAIRDSGVNPVSELDWSVHIPADWAAEGIAWLCTEAAAPFAGTDFSIKTEEGRALVGLSHE